MRVEELEGGNAELLIQVEQFRSGLDQYKKTQNKNFSKLLNNNIYQQNNEDQFNNDNFNNN